jgi:PAS domain S-box-containing protein
LAHALEQSEERFQLLVRRVNVGVFRATRDGQLLEVNPALVRMLGYACESELRTLDLHRDLFTEPIESERVRARLARRAIDRFTTRWRRKDGTSIAVRLSMRQVPDNGSGMVFYDGIVDDVTDRIRQQELLRRT